MHGLHTSLLFRWRRDARNEEHARPPAPPAFIPLALPAPASVPVVETASGTIEIEVAGGHRIRAEPGADPAVLRGVAAYCGALSMIAEIDRELAGAKLIIKGPSGPRAHPLIGSRSRASQNALQVAKRLGLGAAAGGAPKSKRGSADGDASGRSRR